MLSFSESVQAAFRKKWRAGAFPGEGSCCTAFLTEDRISMAVVTYIASLQTEEKKRNLSTEVTT